MDFMEKSFILAGIFVVLIIAVIIAVVSWPAPEQPMPQEFPEFSRDYNTEELVFEDTILGVDKSVNISEGIYREEIILTNPTNNTAFVSLLMIVPKDIAETSDKLQIRGPYASKTVLEEDPQFELIYEIGPKGSIKHEVRGAGNSDKVIISIITPQGFLSDERREEIISNSVDLLGSNPGLEEINQYVGLVVEALQTGSQLPQQLTPETLGREESYIELQADIPSRIVYDLIDSQTGEPLVFTVLDDPTTYLESERIFSAPCHEEELPSIEVSEDLKQFLDLIGSMENSLIHNDKYLEPYLKIKLKSTAIPVLKQKALEGKALEGTFTITYPSSTGISAAPKLLCMESNYPPETSFERFVVPVKIYWNPCKQEALEYYYEDLTLFSLTTCFQEKFEEAQSDYREQTLRAEQELDDFITREADNIFNTSGVDLLLFELADLLSGAHMKEPSPQAYGAFYQRLNQTKSDLESRIYRSDCVRSCSSDVPGGSIGTGEEESIYCIENCISSGMHNVSRYLDSVKALKEIVRNAYDYSQASKSFLQKLKSVPRADVGGEDLADYAAQEIPLHDLRLTLWVTESYTLYVEPFNEKHQEKYLTTFKSLKSKEIDAYYGGDSGMKRSLEDQLMLMERIFLAKNSLNALQQARSNLIDMGLIYASAIERKTAPLNVFNVFRDTVFEKRMLNHLEAQLEGIDLIEKKIEESLLTTKPLSLKEVYDKYHLKSVCLEDYQTLFYDEKCVLSFEYESAGSGTGKIDEYYKGVKRCKKPIEFKLSGDTATSVKQVNRCEFTEEMIALGEVSLCDYIVTHLYSRGEICLTDPSVIEDCSDRNECGYASGQTPLREAESIFLAFSNPILNEAMQRQALKKYDLHTPEDDSRLKYVTASFYDSKGLSVEAFENYAAIASLQGNFYEVSAYNRAEEMSDLFGDMYWENFKEISAAMGDVRYIAIGWGVGKALGGGLSYVGARMISREAALAAEGQMGLLTKIATGSSRLRTSLSTAYPRMTKALASFMRFASTPDPITRFFMGGQPLPARVCFSAITCPVGKARFVGNLETKELAESLNPTNYGVYSGHEIYRPMSVAGRSIIHQTTGKTGNVTDDMVKSFLNDSEVRAALGSDRQWAELVQRRWAQGMEQDIRQAFKEGTILGRPAAEEELDLFMRVARGAMTSGPEQLRRDLLRLRGLDYILGRDFQLIAREAAKYNSAVVSRKTGELAISSETVNELSGYKYNVAFKRNTVKFSEGDELFIGRSANPDSFGGISEKISISSSQPTQKFFEGGYTRALSRFEKGGHARITFSNGKYFIEDLGSSGGTRLVRKVGDNYEHINLIPNRTEVLGEGDWIIFGQKIPLKMSVRKIVVGSS